MEHCIGAHLLTAALRIGEHFQHVVAADVRMMAGHTTSIGGTPPACISCSRLCKYTESNPEAELDLSLRWYASRWS